MSTETVISIQGVWAGYDGEPAIEEISLDVHDGDFIGLVGPNGSGKTTLLKVLLGLVKPWRGRVQVLGRAVVEGRRFIGYVPQGMEFDRDFPIRVRDVVRMGRLGQRRLLQRYTPQDEEAVEASLSRLDILDLARKPIGDLSGGQRQRVMIARALAVDPRILLLDEPTASIDPRVTGSVYELLRRLNEHVTIILVTHDIGVISSHVKTVGCLNRRLIYHGTGELSAEMLEATYQCPVDLIAHGVPHRVFPSHGGGGH